VGTEGLINILAGFQAAGEDARWTAAGTAALRSSG
jgi:hypothetical protein